MKISVLTATYNRKELLRNLYNSLIKNMGDGIQIEWLIMDDGSNDDTEELIKNLKNEKKIEIQYYYQQNQGKMVAINKLVEKASGELIVDCDSDDFFIDKAFSIIKEEYTQNINYLDDVYALCFLKSDKKGKNIGKKFNKNKTTMFELYFKEGEDGEKALVFLSKIRKKYQHEIEKKENFVTEARMYYKMDEKYKIICINKPIMICEYQEQGYTNNIMEQFLKNPQGYYKYFKEILQRDMKGVVLKKRLYVIKHYILFGYLTKQYQYKEIKNFENKILFILLWIPGILKSYFLKKQNK